MSFTNNRTQWDGLDDFGQKIDLTVKIREILRNYPEGLSIIKEILQNADDAGARTVRFVLSEARSSAENADKLSVAMNGPSLLAYNDATFAETDFASIQRIGESLKKSGTGNKTGRFGVGFNSAYHLTEVPIFASGKKIVLFDPSASYVPGVNPANPGKMIDITTKNGKEVIDGLPDVFDSLKLFGCDLVTDFKGTIFRFALRTVDQAKVSSLSRQFHTHAMIKDLLSQLRDASSNMLLFLKSIENIEIYNWDSTETEPTLIHSTCVNSPSPSLRAKRSFVLTATTTSKPQFSDYAMEIQHTSINNKKSDELFVVCNQLGGGNASIMASNPELSHMKLIPWSGVAAKIKPVLPVIDGHAYCFLPLPVKTGLPVHVNGYFELSSNRRDVWWGDDMAGDGKARADWNRAIVTDIAASCYCRLVEHCVRSNHVTKTSYEDLFPVTNDSRSPLWEILANTFFERIKEKEVFYSTSLNKWVSPSSAILISDPFSDSQSIIPILQLEDLPIVLFHNDSLRTTFIRRNICKLMADPAFVRSHYSCQTNSIEKHPSLLTENAVSNAKLLLLYAVLDLNPSSYSKLSSLPFVPLANNTLGLLSILKPTSPIHLEQLKSLGFTTLVSSHALRLHEGRVDDAIEWLFEHRHEASSVVTPGLDNYFVVEGDAAELLAPSPYTFVDVGSLGDDLKKLFLNKKFQEQLNVQSFETNMLGDVVSRALPSAWRGEENAIWDKLSPNAQPSVEWISSFWRYICSHPEAVSYIAEQYCIVPTNQGLVVNLSRGASVVSASILPSMLQSALISLGVRSLLDNLLSEAVVVVPKQIYEYIHSPSQEEVIFAIDSALRRLTNEKKDDPWPTLSTDMRSSLYAFLVAEVSPNAPLMTSLALKMLKSFPIFKTYGGNAAMFTDIDSSSDYDSKYILAQPPSSTDELILTPQFLRCDTQAELKFLQGLDVKVLSRQDLYRQFVLPHIASSMEISKINAVVSQLLAELPNLCRDDPKMRGVVASYACVPSASGQLHKAGDLFDPENHQLKVLLDDDAFPSDFFRDSNLLVALHTIGLQTNLTFDAVIECARRIDGSASKYVDCDDEVGGDGDEVKEDDDETTSIVRRSRELLSCLDKNTESFFPEMFVRVEKKSSFFKSFTSAIFDDGEARRKSGNEQVKRISLLKSLRWLPVFRSSPNPYVPWSRESRKSPVASPTNSRCVDDIWLASYHYSLISSSIHTPELKQVLGFSDPLPLKNVATQLKMMAILFDEKKSNALAEKVEVVESGDCGEDALADRAALVKAKGLMLSTMYQHISSEVPRIYHLLNQVQTKTDRESLRTVLFQSKFIWVGDSFISSDHAAFTSPINAAPYLHTVRFSCCNFYSLLEVPPDVCVFSTLLKTFGVRQRFRTSDFCDVLKRIYDDQMDSKLKDEQNNSPPDLSTVDLCVNLALLVSDDSIHLSDLDMFAPDSQGWLHPTSALVYDDAPWLSKSLTRKDITFVHPKISVDVGERLGVKSLRRLLVNVNSEALDFGVPHEAFGQAESLTRRLRSIIEMYPEGPSILSELIQNSDDAGATVVKVMVSKKKNGTSSLLGPKMGAWQGSSIYVYNDSKFTDRDFHNLSRIGQASKLDNLNSTGRFGLGFNSVFHWTDIPSLVTNNHVVMFDPHERFVPGATSTSRGIKIKYTDSDLLDQFPDQFLPYCHFGCDMRNAFDGTLFRFPLRSTKSAAESEISKTTFDDAKIDELITTFKSAVPRFLLFLRNVRKVEVYMEDDNDKEPRLLYSAEVSDRKDAGALAGQKKIITTTVAEFISGPPNNLLSKEAFYTKLTQTPESELPETAKLVSIKYSDLSITTTPVLDVYLVCVGLGGGRAKEMACDEKYRQLKFIPLGGVAAHLLRNEVVAPKTTGNAFCFLPLPVLTGLPVHINGYFELSSNRRDIWTGHDMTGEGRTRAEWNERLLSDVIGPLYATLLLHASQILGSGQRFFDLWPVKDAASPWQIVITSLYLKSQRLPLFSTSSGKWISSNDAVIIESNHEGGETNLKLLNQKKHNTDMLTSILSAEALPVVVLPSSLAKLIRQHGGLFSNADPQYVRDFFKQRSSTSKGFVCLKTRANALFLLKFVISDIDNDDYSSLQNLPLLPLADKSFGTFGTSYSAMVKYIAKPSELVLLNAALSEIVDTGSGDDEVNELLKSKSLQDVTNIRVLNGQSLLSLLPTVFPKEWQGFDEVIWDGSNSTISTEWIRHFWSYYCSASHADDGEMDVLLSYQNTFPILPCNCKGGEKVLIKLKERMGVVSTFKNSTDAVSSLPSDVVDVLNCIGIKILDPDSFDASTRSMVIQQLTSVEKKSGGAQYRYAQLPTSAGVLRAIANLFDERIEDGDLTRRFDSRFRNVDNAQREALRGFFRLGAESLDDSLLKTLKALPVFPCVRRSAGTDESASGIEYLDLLTDQRWIAPSNSDRRLLNNCFLSVSDRRDLALLEMLGVGVMEGKQFYTSQVLPRLSENVLSIDVRNKVALKLLHDYNGLTPTDGTVDNKDFTAAIANSELVANRKGSYVSPKALFDPQSLGLVDLLGAEFFPQDLFCTPAILTTLRSLGMSSTLSYTGVLESAKSVEADAISIDEAVVASAIKRSACLLKFVDTHIEQLIKQLRDDEGYSSDDGRGDANEDEDDNTELEQGEEIDIDKLDDIRDSRLDLSSTVKLRFSKATAEGSFVYHLSTIAWLPIRQDASLDPLLPKSTSSVMPSRPLAAAIDSRPFEDAWLCSSSKKLLEGATRSELLMQCFGYDKPCDITTVTLQLLALSSLNFGEREANNARLRQFLISTIPKIYNLMHAEVQKAENEKSTNETVKQSVNGMKQALKLKKWLWVEGYFVTADRVAFESKTNAKPHLFTVPFELELFSPFLKEMGVKPTFTAAAFARVNEELFKTTHGTPLIDSDLELTIAMSKLLGALPLAVREESMKASGRAVYYLPSKDGILFNSAEMAFDDAPWLSSSLTGKMRLKFVHPLVGETALNLGAKSLREILLANTNGVQTIPCPTPDSLNQLLSTRAKDRKDASNTTKRSSSYKEDARVLLDLLEVGELEGAADISIVLDWNSHPDESLLHPGLAPCQASPSIFVCFHDIVLSVDALVKASAPSHFYRSSSTKFESKSGLPRFGSGVCGLYQLTDCLQVISGNQLHLFDPCGQHLFSGQGDVAKEVVEKDAKANKKIGKPVARRYQLTKGDVFDNFKDQYAPFLSFFGMKESLASQDCFFRGTCFRIPLRTTSSTLSKRTFERRADALKMIQHFATSLAPTSFLFTKSLKSINIDQRKVGSKVPSAISRIHLRSSPLVRNNHVKEMESNSEWKKKGISAFFAKAFQPIKMTTTIEIGHSRVKEEGVSDASEKRQLGDDDVSPLLLPENEEETNGDLNKAHVMEEIVDTYMITSILAPRGIRELASNRDKFRKLGIKPIIRIAAMIDRTISGLSAKFKTPSGSLFVTFDTGIKTGLPFVINAPFFCHELSRQLMFDNDQALRSLVPRPLFITGGGTDGAAHPLPSPLNLWDWNREVLTSTMVEVIPEFMSSLLNSSVEGRNVYRFWPKYDKTLPPFKVYLSPSVYKNLARLNLFLTQRSGFQAISEGVFESSREYANSTNATNVTNATIGNLASSFFKKQFNLFNVPSFVCTDIQNSGVITKQMTPETARKFLKTGIGKEQLEAIIDGNEELAVELLLFCLADAKVETDVSQPTKRIWNDLKGLSILPMGDGRTLAEIGSFIAIIGTKSQQLLLPAMGASFVSALCVEKLKPWFDDVRFLEAVKIVSFTPSVLSSYIGSVLPTAWLGKDFVEWKNGSSLSNETQSDEARSMKNVPSKIWLKRFWSEVDISNVDEVALFSKWPLIPTTSGELASCSNLKFILIASAKCNNIPLKRSLAAQHRQLDESFAREAEMMAADRARLLQRSSNGQTVRTGVDDDELFADSDDDESDEDEEEEEAGGLEAETEGALTNEIESGDEQAGEVDGGGSRNNVSDDGIINLFDSSDEEEEEDGSNLEVLPVAQLINTSLPPLPPTVFFPSPGRFSQQQQQLLQEDEELLQNAAQQQLQQQSESQMIELQVLLEKLHAPLVEIAYFSDAIAQKLVASSSSDRTSVSRKVLTTLSHCMNFWPNCEVDERGAKVSCPRLKWADLDTAETDRLLVTIAMNDQMERLTLLSTDLTKLRELPLFETLAGRVVPLPQQTDQHFFTFDNSLQYDELEMFLPESAKNRFLKEKPVIIDLLRDLDVKSLTEAALLTAFVLPEFASLPANKQELVSSRIQRRWEILSSDEPFKSKLKSTPFVKRSTAQRGGIEMALPRDLYDPRHELLSVIFDDQQSAFPAEEFAGDGWLDILNQLGLKNDVDKDTFLKCAHKVASDNSIEKAIQLHSYLGMKFADFYEPQFAKTLSDIACVPAQDVHGVFVLGKFKNLLIPKDRHLGYTQLSVIPDAVSPPQVMWSSLSIVSPPRIDTVLAHLRCLTVDGSLEQWSYKDDIEQVFQSIFHFLDESFEQLSPAVKKGLGEKAIVPVGITLVKASRLFFRLSHDLSPFLYEVPRAFNCDSFWKAIGVRQAPSVSDYGNCLIELKAELCDCRLNSNELNAVLKVLKLISEEKVSSGVSLDIKLFGVDEKGVLVETKKLIYNDAPWLIVGGRLDRNLIRLCHPKLSLSVVESLELRKLSICTVEILENNLSPEIVDEPTGSTSSSKLERTMQSSEFAAGVENLKKSTERSDRSTARTLSSIKVKFVSNLQTRFILLDNTSNSSGGVDVTANRVGTLCFVDKKSINEPVVFIALPLLPKFLPVSLVLAMNMCDLLQLNREHVGTISAMIACEPSEIGLTLTALRVKGQQRLRGGDERNDEDAGNCFELDNDAVEFGRGTAGNKVLGVDLDLIELRPTRTFNIGEAVAFKDESGLMNYCVVLGVNSNVDDNEDVHLKRVRVDMGRGRIADLLSSQVYSFRSGGSMAMAMAEDQTEAASSARRVEFEAMSNGDGLLESIRSPDEENRTANSSSLTNSAASLGKIRGVDTDQMMLAVEDILRSGGLSLKSDTKMLFAEIAKMREESKRREKHNESIVSKVKELAIELEKINEAFLCPITRDIMTDPVICVDGHSYEREAIQRWLVVHDRSPKTNTVLESKALLPNITLRQQIESNALAASSMNQFLQYR